jgi:type I restriction enzyme S subunit
VLDSLDSKIKLNRKLNATLEHIGKVIFKRWFVDFEFPNEKGKPYKSNGGEMENSEMGRIPRGWRVSTIGKELSAILGGTPDRTRREYWENGDVPWINSGKVNEFRITEPAEYITREGLDNSATKLLPKRTTVLAITGATLGQVSLLEIDSCANQSVVGILASEKIPSEYIYFWTKHIIGDIISWQTGGAQQHINKENVNNSPLLIPDNHLLSKYSEIVKPIFDRITSNCFENSSLSRIRDFLLPKLMSGEIRVNPAKAESEART